MRVAWKPALAVAAVAGFLLVALSAREMGGGPRAQVVAAMSWAVTPALVLGGHLLQPSIFDVVAWAGVSLLLVGLLLPVYPLRVLHSTPEAAVSYYARETVGWPALVATVAKVYRPGEIILAGDYGVAGAIHRYGPAYGLPESYSVQNGLWYIARPPDGDAPVLVVRASGDYLRRFWNDVRPVGTIDNRLHVANEEQGQQIWLCTGQRLPWTRLWPSLKELG